jgi:glycosyltransferase involved in cell wall biosynthesis
VLVAMQMKPDDHFFLTRGRTATGPAQLRLPRVAVVHDWLVAYGGAERVTEQLLRLFPQADLFAVIDFLPAEARSCVLNKAARTTFVQHLPRVRNRYRSYLPLMPLAIEQLDVSAYDIVLSSSHAVAKGVITGPHQLHISYVHSPMRYAWDLQHQYLRESGLDRRPAGWLARWLLHRLRMWDLRTSNGVDFFVANSQFIRRRIAKVYRRDAAVIYPPVDIERFRCHAEKEDFFLTASRLVPYKRVDLIVEAFTCMPDKRLVVVGDGPDLARIRARSTPNVEVRGFLPTETLCDLMQRARAFVFAAEEDFGIVAVEAQACGTPLIAFSRGGNRETVRGLGRCDPTGVFFGDQSVAALCAAVRTFEQSASAFTPAACRANAECFSAAHFRTAFASFVAERWREFARLELTLNDASPGENNVMPGQRSRIAMADRATEPRH